MKKLTFEMSFQRRIQFFQRFGATEASAQFDLFRLTGMDSAAANSDAALRNTLTLAKLTSFYLFRTPVSGSTFPPTTWTETQLVLYNSLARGGVLSLNVELGRHRRTIYLPYFPESPSPESPLPVGFQHLADRSQLTIAMYTQDILSGSSDLGTLRVMPHLFYGFDNQPVIDFSQLTFALSLFTAWDVVIGAYAQEYVLER